MGSIDRQGKRLRVQGQRIVSDRSGRIQRTETRLAFWRLLRRLCPKAVADLLDIEPARRALAAWPDHAAANPDATRTLSGLAELNYPFPWPGGMWDDDLIYHMKDRLGPLYDWPFKHLNDWSRRYDLFSDTLRVDILHTLTKNFRIVDGEPVLDPFEIPTHVNVCWMDADIADRWINDPNYFYDKGPRLVFDEHDLQHLMWTFSELYYADDLSFDEANELAVEDAMRIARINAEIAVRRRERTAGRTELRVPHDDWLIWFIRLRVKGERVETVARDAGRTIDAIKQEKAKITRLLDLPPQRRRPSSSSRHA